MTISIIVIESVILAACIALLIYAYKIGKVIVAVAYGIQESFNLTEICYAHHNFANSSIKIILDHLGDEYNDKFNQAIAEEDYEMAKYYKSIVESTIKLKMMTNEDIESLQ